MNLQPRSLQDPALPIELLELNLYLIMETSGIEPEITTCKVAVLPIKLCPLYIDLNHKLLYILFIYYKPNNNIYIL